MATRGQARRRLNAKRDQLASTPPTDETHTSSREETQSRPTSRKKKRREGLFSRVLVGLGLKKTTPEPAAPDTESAPSGTDSGGASQSRSKRGKRRNWATWIANTIERTVGAVRDAVTPTRDTEPDSGTDKPNEGDDHARPGEAEAENAEAPDTSTSGDDDAEPDTGEQDAPDDDAPSGKKPKTGATNDGSGATTKPHSSSSIRDAIRGGGAVGSSKLKIKINISSDTNKPRTVTSGNSRITDSMRMRWATIDMGRLPEDDSTERPWSEDEIKEKEKEAVNPIERKRSAAQARITDEMKSAALRLIRNANAADEEAAMSRDADEARAARRRASRYREQAKEERDRGKRKLDALNVRMDEAADDAKKGVRKEAEKVKFRAEERLSELQSGLHAEIEKAVQFQYFEGDQSVELVEYYISDAETDHG